MCRRPCSAPRRHGGQCPVRRGGALASQLSVGVLNRANCGKAGLAASQDRRSSVQISIVGGQASGSSTEAVVTSNKLGRACGRESVCQTGSISVVAVLIKNKTTKVHII